MGNYENPSRPYENQALAKQGGIRLSISGADAPRSPSPIRDEISRIEDLVTEAHKGLSAVSERLDTVTVGEGIPPSLPPSPSPAAVSSNVHDRLMIIVTHLRYLCDRLQDIHGRIEV